MDFTEAILTLVGVGSAAVADPRPDAEPEYLAEIAKATTLLARIGSNGEIKRTLEKLIELWRNDDPLTDADAMQRMNSAVEDAEYILGIKS